MDLRRSFTRIVAATAGRVGQRHCTVDRRWRRMSLPGHRKGSRKGTVQLPASLPDRAKLHRANWSESFIFAGASGLLLLVVNVFTDYWYLSFVALSPLLYRMLGATPREALRLGFLFGLSFLSVSTLGNSSFSLMPAASKIMAGTALFALFGWSVGLARRRWGFNPLIVALLWVGFEPWLVKLGFAGGIFKQADLSHPLFNGVGGLFGFLIISLIIILCNSLLAWAIKQAASSVGVPRRAFAEEEQIWRSLAHLVFPTDRAYLMPDVRGPPLVA